MRAKPILYLAGALACVVLILMLSGGDGLRAATTAQLEAETEAYPSAERQVRIAAVLAWPAPSSCSRAFSRAA